MGGTVLRTYVQSSRSDRQHLRVTWHAETGTIVLSHWDDRVCVASTPIALADAPVLIELLVAALADAAAAPSVEPPALPARAPSLLERVWSGLRGVLRPHLAQIIPLRSALRSHGREPAAVSDPTSRGARRGP